MLVTPLQGFSHPALLNYDLIWKLNNVPQLRQYINAVKDPDNKRLAEEAIDVFCDTVLPNLEKCQKCK